jgi:hypothetical protein
MFAVGEEGNAVGFHHGAREVVREPDGTRPLPPHRPLVMVPLRVRVPDTTALQPGLQPWPPDLKDPRRAKGHWRGMNEWMNGPSWPRLLR